MKRFESLDEIRAFFSEPLALLKMKMERHALEMANNAGDTAAGDHHLIASTLVEILAMITDEPHAEPAPAADPLSDSAGLLPVTLAAEPGPESYQGPAATGIDNVERDVIEGAAPFSLAPEGGFGETGQD